jgi:hypothetical protein
MTTTLPIDLPPSDEDIQGLQQCDCAGCTQMVMPNMMVGGCIQVGSTTHQGRFCSFDCRNQWRDYMRPGVCYSEH